MSGAPSSVPSREIATVSVLVRDYDEAIAWYRDCLGFGVAADVDLGGGKRWVVVAPASGRGARLLLARAEGEAQIARIGDQAGGRVFLFLETDDFFRDHAAMIARGVAFREEPRREAYGTVAVFQDFCGNLWDLIEPRRGS
jgi:catechol 2,3-dioxygenase-like lactoylglutathione lyase family enzyme